MPPTGHAPLPSVAAPDIFDSLVRELGFLPGESVVPRIVPPTAAAPLAPVAPAEPVVPVVPAVPVVGPVVRSAPVAAPAAVPAPTGVPVAPARRLPMMPPVVRG